MWNLEDFWRLGVLPVAEIGISFPAFFIFEEIGPPEEAAPWAAGAGVGIEGGVALEAGGKFVTTVVLSFLVLGGGADDDISSRLDECEDVMEAVRELVAEFLVTSWYAAVDGADAWGDGDEATAALLPALLGAEFDFGAAAAGASFGLGVVAAACQEGEILIRRWLAQIRSK